MGHTFTRSGLERSRKMGSLVDPHLGSDKSASHASFAS
jgi:hypothetical protein